MCDRTTGFLALVLFFVGVDARPQCSASTKSEGLVYEHGAVVAVEPRAAEIGAAMLQRGGNAVDAAVATALSLAVTFPEAGNLGGGGFLLFFEAETGTVTSLDFRETAPLASSPTMYLDDRGQLLEGHRLGPRAAGVPGTVAGLHEIHRRSGQLPWKDLVAGALRLAEEGFPVSQALADSLNRQIPWSREVDQPGRAKGPLRLTRPGTLSQFSSSTQVFAHPENRPWREGDRLRQPELAATLQRLSEEGWREFYDGRTAQLIIQAMQADGGIITLDDLSNYRPKFRDPIQVDYQGYQVYGAGPPTSGGFVIALALKILDRLDLDAAPRNSPRTIHLVTEALRRAFHLRALALADPDVIEVPIDRLLSDEVVDQLSGSIDPNRATPSSALSPLEDLLAAGFQEGDQTTHLSVLDAEGNAVALTYTLEQRFGSKYTVPGAGFLLNNEMGDFNLIPGLTNEQGRIGTEPNLIAPGKRMLSSQSPTLVIADGRAILVTGSPGGRTIPSTTLWTLLNRLTFELEPARCVNAPRTAHMWFPDQILWEDRTDEPGWQASREDLLMRGHSFRLTPALGAAHSLFGQADGTIIAVPDRRRADASASGY